MKSNSDSNIRYIAIANLVDKSIVIEYAPKKEKLLKLQSSVKDIIEKLILISITANERHTESMNDDLKILTVVDKSVRWCFITITLQSFPERIGYQMISELENKTLKTLNTKFFKLGNNTDTKHHSDDIQLSMVELYQKYKDPSNVDRLFEIKRDVNDIRKDMDLSVKKMVSNIDSTSILESKSEKIKFMGQEYKKTASQLESSTRWGNWKTNLLMGGVATSGLGYLVYLLFFK